MVSFFSSASKLHSILLLRLGSVYISDAICRYSKTQLKVSTEFPPVGRITYRSCILNTVVLTLKQHVNSIFSSRILVVIYSWKLSYILWLPGICHQIEFIWSYHLLIFVPNFWSWTQKTRTIIFIQRSSERQT